MVGGYAGRYLDDVPSLTELVMSVWLVTVTDPLRFSTEPFEPRGGATLVCRILNEADDERRVRVEALDARGSRTHDSGSFPLAAGASYASGGGVEARRCRFTVQGDPSGVRAHGLIVSPALGVVSLAPKRER